MDVLNLLVGDHVDGVRSSSEALHRIEPQPRVEDHDAGDVPGPESLAGGGEPPGLWSEIAFWGKCSDQVE